MEEEKEADTWITPKSRRCCRKPPFFRPDQTQAAAERARAVVTAKQYRNNSFTAFRSEHIPTSGSDTGSDISSIGKIHVAENTASQLQIRQLRIRRHEAESTLSHHDYRIRMALQHAQGDRSGKVLAWLLREAHHGTPAMSIKTPDGTVANTQLAINDTFRAYYQQLYEQPADLRA
ncbi:hypothetical protein NDU88_000833 [Pleurodeles waltl]|uniref:Uncharacterized protein n=1 Tax=Pleurodeles waltl TaxID=8319 RepID=A0AAV7TGN0_PLEWA|nr:hypothetical protein NDU88_000833 [Pleurodeles waltl]